MSRRRRRRFLTDPGARYEHELTERLNYRSLAEMRAGLSLWEFHRWAAYDEARDELRKQAEKNAERKQRARAGVRRTARPARPVRRRR